MRKFANFPCHSLSTIHFPFSIINYPKRVKNTIFVWDKTTGKFQLKMGKLSKVRVLIMKALYNQIKA